MLSLVIDRLADFLSSSPNPVLAAERVGAKIPSGGGDTPAVVISLDIESTRADGIGRFIREGHLRVQNTAIVEVTSGVEPFSTDLRLLHLSPLPIQRNPASTAPGFSDSDVAVRNVTNPAQPVAYRMVERPAQKEEYRVDVLGARIQFGAPQTAGEKLEVVHWTLAFRDDIVSSRYAGLMLLEVWASSFNQANDLSRRLQLKLSAAGATLRGQGFAKLQPARLEPVEDQLHQPAVGSAFPVWKQKLGYRFEFESESGGEVSSGTRIEKIEVDTGQQAGEKFSVPKTTS